MLDRPRRGHRPPDSGRRPAGPDGTPRSIPLGFKVAASERADILALAERRGFTPDPTGVRAFLLALAAERDDQATQPQAA